jgi:NhaP-type Na+/H+ or K+/H+ antiporter
MHFNQTLMAILSSVMAVLSVVAAASWSSVVPPDVAFYVITGTLGLNAGLHALQAAAQQKTGS